MQVLVTTELSPEDNERLKSEFPVVQFVFATEPDDVLRAANESEVIYCNHPSEDLIDASPNLRWVQVRSAGVEHVPMDLLFARDIILTNGSGAHSVVAENILAMMFAFAVRLPALIDSQRKQEWTASRIYGAKFQLEGQTLLIAGLGAIGGALARKASGLGLHVLGVRNRPLGKPEGVDELIAREDLPAALGRADHVALCLPATSGTSNFLGARELGFLKTTGYIYNVGRSSAIDQDALVQALTDGAIAGAGLDVTEPEPLPPDSPLWPFKNVILTQHTSGGSAANSRLVTDIFIDNLRRFIANEPLRNVVDPVLRY